MDALLQRLLNQAYLFDDPRAYAAGVQDAFDVLAPAQGDEGGADPQATRGDAAA